MVRFAIFSAASTASLMARSAWSRSTIAPLRVPREAVDGAPVLADHFADEAADLGAADIERRDQAALAGDRALCITLDGQLNHRHAKVPLPRTKFTTAAADLP
jgi:hypothetical protein